MAAAKKEPRKGDDNGDENEPKANAASGGEGSAEGASDGDTTAAMLADERAQKSESRAIAEEQARKAAEADRDAALGKLRTANTDNARLRERIQHLEREIRRQKAENAPDLSAGACQLGESVTIEDARTGGSIPARPGDILVGVKVTYEKDARTGQQRLVPGLTAKDQKTLAAVEKESAGLYRVFPVDADTVQEVEARGLTRG